MRRLSRVVATVTSVAAIALSTGCGEDNPTPSTAPSSSPAKVSPSPSTSVAPTPPRAMQSKSERGAIATVRYFLESMAYAGDTGDVDQFRLTYAETCTKCEAIASGIDRTYAAGGSIRGGDWTPTSFKFYSIQGNIAYLDAAVDYSQQRFVATEGAKVDIAPSQKDVLKAFQLIWDGAWQVGALDPQA